jgi:lipoprotein-releasing system permease protein
MVWKIALRHVLGEKRRTLILTVSLAFAAFVGIVGNTIVSSLESNINRGLRSGLLGDLQVVDGRVRTVDITAEPDAKSHLISEAAIVERLLSNAPSVRAVAPRLRVSALLMSEEFEAPAVVMGVDPSKDADTCPGSDPSAMRSLAKGKILLGPGIADRLGLVAGEDVTLLVDTPDGLFEGDVLEVAGAHEPGGLPLFGEFLAFMRLNELQEMLGLKDEVSSFAVALTPGTDLSRMQHRLQREIEPLGLRAVSWIEAAGPFVDIGRIGMLGVAFTNTLLWLVIALGVGNTFLIIVIERRRQIGAMMALGTSRHNILCVVLAESALISCASAVTGALLSLALCLPLAIAGVPVFSRAMMFAFGGERFFPEIAWPPFAVGFLVIAVLGPLSALLPAVSASRVDPVEAMRAR